MFTLVHLHLIINHFPIIVTALGLVLIAFAAWRADDYLTRISLWVLVGGAVSGLPTYYTGDPASHAVRGLPGVSKDLIHAHSSMALIAAIFVGVLGVFALWTLWRYARPAIVPRGVTIAILIGAAVGSGLMAYTGLLGGEIRHTEVRSDFVPPPPSTPAVNDSVRH